MKLALLGLILSFAATARAEHWRKVDCQFADYPTYGQTLETSADVSEHDQMRIHEAYIVDGNLDRRSENLLERYDWPLGGDVGLKDIRFKFALSNKGNADYGNYFEFVLPRNWAIFNGPFAATFRPGEFTPAEDKWGEYYNGTCTAD